jgi:hypothetical protein
MLLSFSGIYVKFLAVRDASEPSGVLLPYLQKRWYSRAVLLYQMPTATIYESFEKKC